VLPKISSTIDLSQADRQLSPPPSCCAHCAAPTALPQGRHEHAPLTLLVSAAFHAQQLGFGDRRLLSPLLFVYSFLAAILIVVVSLSTLTGDISTLHKRGHFYFALTEAHYRSTLQIVTEAHYTEAYYILHIMPI